MKIDKVIQRLQDNKYKYYKHFSGYIKKYNLDMDDILQDASINVYNYSLKYEIEENKLDGFLFLTVRNIFYRMAPNLNKKNKLFNSNLSLSDNDDDNDDFKTIKESILEDKSPDFSSYYINILSNYATQEDIDEIISYYNGELDKSETRRMVNKIGRIKGLMGYQYYFELYNINEDKKTNHKSYEDIANYMGTTSPTLSAKLRNGTTFTYLNVKYRIRKIIKYTNI